MMNTMLVKGNVALAEGAVRAGCKFYAGYPITPQSEILEWMSLRQPEVGGVCLQGESEVASICMVYTAAGIGERAMTSSSGAGYSLKQEGLAYLVAAELPAVIGCVQRFGIGDGFIGAGQDNYWQVVKGGGNGDYKLVVLAPNSPQECADMTYEAFDIADKYRHPVVVLSDATVGQMIEPVTFPEYRTDLPKKEWAAHGTELGEGKHKSILDVSYIEGLKPWNEHYMEKIYTIREEEQRWESEYVEDADVVFVAYGISSRSVAAAVAKARKKGLKLGYIRPITLWPFPHKAFEAIPSTCKNIVTVEMNFLAQMLEDVILTTGNKLHYYSITTGPDVATQKQIIQFAEDVMAGNAKETEVF